MTVYPSASPLWAAGNHNDTWRWRQQWGCGDDECMNSPTLVLLGVCDFEK